MTTIDRLATLRAVAAPIFDERRQQREQQEAIRKAMHEQDRTNWHMVMRFLGLVGEDETVEDFSHWQKLNPDVFYTVNSDNQFVVKTSSNIRYLNIPNHTDVRGVGEIGVLFTVYTPDEVFRQAVARTLIELGIIKE